jgi:hypothetical protein
LDAAVAAETKVVTGSAPESELEVEVGVVLEMDRASQMGLGHNWAFK